MSWYWQPAHQATETNLQTLAWNITTLGGRLRMAGRRGENVLIPFREGRLWVPKTYEETELTLAMWVVGCEQDGSIPADPSDQFWENVEVLKRLFWTDRALGILSYDHRTAGVRVFGEAEIVDEIDFQTDAGATRAAFTVDFVLPKVWFRPSVFEGPAEPQLRSDESTWSREFASDVPIKDGLVTFSSAGGSSSANPTLFNESLSNTDHWVRYASVLAVDDVVVIDVGEWNATLNGTDDVSNNLNWSGQPEFFQVIPGENDFRFTGEGITGVSVQAKGRYW